MFASGEFRMLGPICTCEKQSATWACPRDEKNHAILVVTCKTCNTSVTIPWEKFKVLITFGASMGTQREESKQQQRIRDTGNVVNDAMATSWWNLFKAKG